MYDPALPEEGVQGWELAQFLPEDEELFSFDTSSQSATVTAHDIRTVDPLEQVLGNHYRLILARNRQKLMAAEKHLVRARVALHNAYTHKVQQLVHPLPELGHDEFLVTHTSNGPSVHTLNGDRQPITWGHIMSGYEWGIEYVLDPATFSYDDRHAYLNRLFKHRIALLDTEHELLELLVDAYKDERPEMAEAVKQYRMRYRALFNIETGRHIQNNDEPAVRALKMLRAFLVSLVYSFPSLELDVRTAHPVEEVGYGIHLLVTRKGADNHQFARIAVKSLTSELKAINQAVLIESSPLRIHHDPHSLRNSSWETKLASFSHDGHTCTSVHLDDTIVAHAYQAWHGENDLLEHALRTPDKQMTRDFWATVINEALKNLLTTHERQMIISTL